MRYPACQKLEIIQLVEQSHLPVRRTLEKLGVPLQDQMERCVVRLFSRTQELVFGSFPAI